MDSTTVSAPAGATFEEVVLPNLDAAYRLARWLTGNQHDAEDIVQEASLRALRYFQTFSGGNGRAWFLRIVRNTCYGWRNHEPPAPVELFDEEQHSGVNATKDPEALLIDAANVELINEAIGSLPERSRELLVLREIEGLSYQELADVLEIPIGTVMSGLSRARQALRRAVVVQLELVDQEPALALA